jgi:hypothetical protein
MQNYEEYFTEILYVFKYYCMIILIIYSKYIEQMKF